LAAVGAVLLWMALPPLSLGPLGWIAPVPWILLARRQQLSGRRPYGALWLVGFLFWLATIHWLRLPHPATNLGWIALSFYLAFYLPVFVGFTRVAADRLRVPVIVAAPVVWTGLELARAHLLTGFSMAALAHSQYRWIALIQISDLAGEYAVDFVMVFVAACMAPVAPQQGQRPTIWPLVPAALLLAATLAYGYARIAQGQASSTGPLTRVALIQGSIDSILVPEPDTQDDTQECYFRLTQQALDRYGRVDLIVWPESMFRDRWISFTDNAVAPRGWNGSQGQFHTVLQRAAESNRRVMAYLAGHFSAAMLLGINTEHYDSRGVDLLNSAIFVTRRGEVTARYDKIHCVMFGEYVPLVQWFPCLQRLTPLTGSATAGTQPVAMELEHLRIAPNICYESVLSHVIRNQLTTLARANEEPDVLVNLTNDGWFWGSSELDMHLVCGVFRAVECRKPFLIAANTGFSAWIDADGRLLARGPRRAEAVLLAEVRPDPRKSWYLRYGDWPASVCLAICLALAALALQGWFSRRRVNPPKPATDKG
jgi:apolipoprotein N-acyltransferase